MVKGQVSPWGYGSVRAMYSSNLGGPFGSPGNPLPAYDLNSAYYPGPAGPGYSGSGVYMNTPKFPKMSGVSTVTTGLKFGKRKSKRKFGKRKSKRKFGKRSCSFGTRALTPGGVTTENSWGYMFGTPSITPYEGEYKTIKEVNTRVVGSGCNRLIPCVRLIFTDGTNKLIRLGGGSNITQTDRNNFYNKYKVGELFFVRKKLNFGKRKSKRKSRKSKRKSRKSKRKSRKSRRKSLKSRRSRKFGKCGRKHSFGKCAACMVR